MLDTLVGGATWTTRTWWSRCWPPSPLTASVAQVHRRKPGERGQLWRRQREAHPPPRERRGQDRLRGLLPGAHLTDNVKELGIEVLLTDTPATELIVEDGAVTGVVASLQGHQLQNQGQGRGHRHGRLGANVDLCASYKPELAGFVHHQRPRRATGDGIKLGQAVGAATGGPGPDPDSSHGGAVHQRPDHRRPAWRRRHPGQRGGQALHRRGGHP